MDIIEVKEHKEQYLDLLLLAEEQESIIEKYLQRGILFALYDDFDLKTVAVITKENEDTYEIKNLATLKIYQGKGYGRAMIKHIIQYCQSQCKVLVVGTGDNEEILIFYEMLGFTYSHTTSGIVYLKFRAHPIFCVNDKISLGNH